MATATSNVTIKPSDGWVALTSAATTFLAIKTNGYSVWSLGAGASAPTTNGLRFLPGDGDEDDILIFPSGIGGKVWAKVADSNMGGVQDAGVEFGVIST